MVYWLPPGADVLRLVLLTGVPEEFAASWARVNLRDPVPVADAVRERRLVWLANREEMARHYPQPALVLPYPFALAAAPAEPDEGEPDTAPAGSPEAPAGDTAGPGPVNGGLVLLWPGSHPPELTGPERRAVRACCRELGTRLRRAEQAGLPLLHGPDPRLLTQADERAPREGEAAAALSFIDRLPGGSCALDLDGRVTFVTPAAAKLLGAAEDELLGLVPWKTLPWLADPAFEDRYRGALISREPTSFVALRPPDHRLSFELYPSATGVSVRVTPAERRSPEPSRSAVSGMPNRATTLYHLVHLAASLTASAGVGEVAARAADQILPAAEARTLAILAAEDGRFRLVCHRGRESRVVHLCDGAPLASTGPAAQVLADGGPAFFRTAAELERALPGTDSPDGLSSWAFLPLTASGHDVGMLLLGYARPHRFAPERRAVLSALAGLLAQALDRARLYDAKHDLARSLQSHLLPHGLPEVPGLNVAARYRPAKRGMDIGGDFYDLIRLDDTTAMAAIGDVQGHSVQAAALMGSVRTAVHATAEAPPGEVLARTNRLLTDLDGELFTSCLCARIDLARHRVLLASAGHPPPLLRTPEGRADVLDVPPGLLLGIDRDAGYPTTEIALPPGAVLAFYTDGLVETPGTDLGDAVAALADRLAADGGQGLDPLADSLLRDSGRTPPSSDDVALLLLGPTG
ncbi:SpoIIE family protein phosphatase [Streptomyces sp. JJ36]|nr:SpoIIE family protein phosphatase [Streptomyces sp. JJ36]